MQKKRVVVQNLEDRNIIVAKEKKEKQEGEERGGGKEKERPLLQLPYSDQLLKQKSPFFVNADTLMPCFVYILVHSDLFIPQTLLEYMERHLPEYFCSGFFFFFFFVGVVYCLLGYLFIVCLFICF